jgi:hypothetical protein
MVFQISIHYLNFKLLKQPANPLRLLIVINVRVSGLTESSGTSFWTTLLIRKSLFFFILSKKTPLRFQLASSLLRALTKILDCWQKSFCLVISFPVWPEVLSNMAIHLRLGKLLFPPTT